MGRLSTSTISLVVCFGVVNNLPLSPREESTEYPEQTGYVGAPVTVACHKSAIGSVNWWYQRTNNGEVTEICVNGYLVNVNKNNFMLDPIDFDLTIKNATFNNEGIYTCLEEDGFGARRLTKLHIAEVQYAVVGHRVTLPCGGGSVASPVNWLYQRSRAEVAEEICVNGEVLNENKRIVSLDEHNNYWLTIHAAQANNGGLYTCIENNGFGSRHLIQLNVSQGATVSDFKSTLSTVSPTQKMFSKAGDQTCPHAMVPMVALIVVCIVATILIVAEAACIFSCRRHGRKMMDKRVVSFSTKRDSNHTVDASVVVREHSWTDELKKVRKRGVKDKHRNISALMHQPELYSQCIDELAKFVRDTQNEVEVIAGLDLRGFIFALPVALKLGLPCVLVSKSGIISGAGIATIHKEYQSHEGHPLTMEVQTNTCIRNQKVVIIDEELGAGGSLKAAVECLLDQNVKTVGCVVVVEIQNKGGRQNVAVNTGTQIHSLVQLKP